ncbi:hypothetical protein [Jonesia denitrificans]|uniref:Uncharacterized protein n=1 Tax=Jonesia denitrificans (strain ATCC 14870 / DSM 20603 / BCRC 15368 / CIP 55.134 / JCM 11481 / NBRC 15587 / NCTC 10816 / Prevot 55134) TaxID=471856 RepID=C7R3L4_JONDD|nr:hypothetical protein [Jonesia denitrificans]ACV08750.1 hypothetical protein Jden_1094 [Jonesia denitrificans DSM 20603]ASE09926.1 hypothetical protein CEP80_12915 [Jonesia denitrificans]QXB42262.1 hypothetical protein I6L70_06540 [Jonesia denitrificans]SQH20739.1 Uncharacterised protein [Jonesia denitrificans]
MSNTSPAVTVLLTQVATAQALAAACAMSGAKVWCVDSPIGAYAVTQPNQSGEQLAAALTALAKQAPAVLVSAHDGQIHASQWEEGAKVGDLPPGLVLDGAPHELEDLLLGQTSIDTLPDVVDASTISRFKAMRMLAKNARQYRTEKS